MDSMLQKIAGLVRDPAVQIDTTGFLVALVVSTFVGLIVAGLYQVFYEDRATGSQVHRCFPLMAPSITALFVAVQFSLPLSLGLLGALSIIRFRTPIKEPEEVGFIMLLIATAVVCATFQFLLLGALLLVAVGLLVAQRYFTWFLGSKRHDGVILLTVEGGTAPETQEKVLEELERRLPRGHLRGVSYAENLTTVHYSFSGLRNGHLNGLHASLSKVVPVHKLNVFFNDQGPLL
jgi:hypothetical protein